MLHNQFFPSLLITLIRAVVCCCLGDDRVSIEPKSPEVQWKWDWGRALLEHSYELMDARCAALVFIFMSDPVY